MMGIREFDRDAFGATRQRGIARFLLALLPVLLLESLVALPASASEDAVEPSSFSGFFEAGPHVTVQRARGSVSTNVDSTARKSNLLSNMTFRFSGGLKGPSLDFVPGGPRPVAYLGVLVPLNESGTIGAQLIETNPPGFEIVERAKFSMEYQVSPAAGFGLEFLVPIGDLEIAITPAVESLHLRARYVGETSVSETPIGPGTATEFAIRAKQEITQHFLGPALKLSTPTTAVFGVSVDFFLNANLLFDVAGTREKFGARGEGDDRGEFNFETGSGVAQVGAGLQLRWP